MNSKSMAVALLAGGLSLGMVNCAWAGNHPDSYSKLVEQIKAFDSKQRGALEALVKACYEVDWTTWKGCKAEVKGWKASQGTDTKSTLDQYVAVMDANLFTYELSAMAGVRDASSLKTAQEHVGHLRDGLRDTEKTGIFSSFFK